MALTASKLYDYTQCPHRVWRDLYGPMSEKSEESNPFVELLWERGIKYEEKVISGLGDFLNLRGVPQKENKKQTLQAMSNGVSLIYQGVIEYDGLLGIPDLLKRQPDSTYVPIEIKSGMGREGTGDDESEDEGKLKKHYAIQLGLYLEVLAGMGFSKNHVGYILDGHGKTVEYNLDQPMGARLRQTFWEYYQQGRDNVKLLQSNEAKNDPALSGICKLCPWYQSCKKWVEKNEDPTGLFYVGRSKRDLLNQELNIRHIGDILLLDPKEILAQKKKDKNFIKGLGEKTLNKIIDRARVLKVKQKPVVYEKIDFPKVSYELFFDIEDDPTQEFVYLHGVYERSKNGERFLDFTAKEVSPKAEAAAWKDFWDYIRSLPQNDFAVYYYSAHEKNTYKRMQKTYPEIISEKELENFFANPNVIDLYTNVVLTKTDWPLSSYSIKAIAQYLGFNWRDETPSGALSIQWFNDYLEKNDPKILERILLYNEDDCKATMVVKDAIQNISDKQYLTFQI